MVEFLLLFLLVVLLFSISGWKRISRKTPATTIVLEWSRAETGVGSNSKVRKNKVCLFFRQTSEKIRQEGFEFSSRNVSFGHSGCRNYGFNRKIIPFY